MSAGLASRNAGDAARAGMQMKSFTAWCNLHLAKAGMKAEDLTKDFQDGVMLLRLVEVISEDNLGKYNKKPISKIQKVENLNIPLKYINSFLHEVGIRNTYSAENILDGDVNLILGMVWSLILRFNVSQISEGDLTAKEGLLLWAKTKIGEVTNGQVQITNFHTSWQDGVAFNALIQAYRPDLVDYKNCQSGDGIANLNQAFGLADSELGIPRLLDAEDMVSQRPDEKSVMTYVSFFWKEFAATKRKRLAGERIAHVVQREQSYAELQAQYLAGAKALSEFVTSKTATMQAGVEGNSQAELEVVLRSHLDYGRTEKPTKLQELLGLEALFSSINSRLSLLGREFAPPEDLGLPALQRWWEEMCAAEASFETSLHNTLKNMKQVELLIKLFNSKAGKLEEWVQHKQAWLEVSLERINPTAVAAQLPALSAGGGSPEPPPPAAAAVEADASPAEGRKRQPSFLDNLLDKFAPGKRSSQEDASAAAAPPEVEAPASPSGKPKVPSLRPFASMSNIADPDAVQMTSRGRAMAEGALDSISAVQAKLNMQSAYEEELAGRKEGVPALDKLMARIIEMGCPPFRQFSLQGRTDRIKECLEALTANGEAYVAALRGELERQHKLDEMRVTFAKRSEALNRWMEESLDQLTEILAIDSISDAQNYLSELDSFGTPLASKEGELANLKAFHEEMAVAGTGSNPYSRFKIDDVVEMMQQVDAALLERRERLQDEVSRQQSLDQQKRDFAKAAEDVMAFVRGEKSALDAAAPAIAILPDNTSSITRGKQMLAALEEHMAPAARERRAAQLAPAQQLSETLMAAVELENPYTRQTMSSLKSQMEQLEKVIRDKLTLLEGQLARAQTDINPEQYEEIKAAFLHFDKSGDGMLNQVEFSAALRAMDFELAEAEEESTFLRLAGGKASAGEETRLGLEAFTTYILQQYKDKDTKEELLAAFNVVSGGKETLTPDELKAFVPEAETAFLLGDSGLKPAGGGYEFASWTNAAYGRPADE